MVAGIQQAHAEQLANMRIQDLNVSLKPLNSVNNPILRKRKLLGLLTLLSFCVCLSLSHTLLFFIALPLPFFVLPLDPFSCFPVLIPLSIPLTLWFISLDCGKLLCLIAIILLLYCSAEALQCLTMDRVCMVCLYGAQGLHVLQSLATMCSTQAFWV